MHEISRPSLSPYYRAIFVKKEIRETPYIKISRETSQARSYFKHAKRRVNIALTGVYGRRGMLWIMLIGEGSNDEMFC
jgi:hypothetical protein